MDVLTFLLTRAASTEGFVLVVTIILGYLVYQRRTQSVVAFLATTTGLLVSVPAVKELLRIPRPDTPLIEITGYAFPSGHAAGIAFLALSLIFLSRNLKKPARLVLTIILLGITVVIGISRVYFGVHTELQVLGGYLFGIFWAFVFIALEKRTKRF